ncbi:DNA-3-methyladenine glycosylase 2 family protein, partial [Amycolatopsis sp. NPDC049252]
DVDPGPAVADLAAHPVLGPLVRARPGLVVPGTWSALEVGVRALAGAAGLRTVVESLGTPVPGLPGGLTHTFPPASALTAPALHDLEVPGAAAIAALAEVADHPALGDGTSLGALEAVPGLGDDLRHDLAFRLGVRDAFPSSDPALRTAIRRLGTPGATRWPAHAAAHLLAAA